MRKNIHIFVIFLFLLFFFSCERKNDNIIDPSFDSPLIYSVTKSTDTVFTTTMSPPVINLNVGAIAGRNNGSEIKNIVCKVIDPLSNTLGNISLGKTVDSTYSATINIPINSCLLVGNYNLIFIAENEIGLSSNLITSTIYVKNTANVAPVIIETNLPDSVVRPLTGSVDLTIFVNVTDTNGTCDINDVYFEAYRPSGFIIPGGVIPMTHFLSSEWRFTNPVLPAIPDSSFGYFKYHFFAKDRSNAISTGVWDSIKFVRP